MQRGIAHDFIPLPAYGFCIAFQVPTIDHFEACFAFLGIVISCGFDEGRGRINAVDFCDLLEEVGSELCVAAADVEDVVGWLGFEVLKDLLRDFGVVYEVGGASVVLSKVSR